MDHVISIMVNATSRLDAVSLFAVIVSVVSSTILLPCMNSNDDPKGIGTSLARWMSSEDARVTPRPTLIPLPLVLESVIPITTVVVLVGTA